MCQFQWFNLVDIVRPEEQQQKSQIKMSVEYARKPEYQNASKYSKICSLSPSYVSLLPLLLRRHRHCRHFFRFRLVGIAIAIVVVIIILVIYSHSVVRVTLMTPDLPVKPISLGKIP